MPHLTRITIYPVKSFDGLDVPEAVVLPSGALNDDRRFALFDADGRVVNGKRTSWFHRVRSSYDPAARVLTVGERDGGGTFAYNVDADRDALNAWLSERLGDPVTVREAPETGFPDDTEAPGPTVIAAATLEAVAAWFGGLEPDDCRRRFRANLEVGGVEPFWDDRLYAETGGAVAFRVGGVVFEGVNPCQRCAVPARSPETGEPIPGFQKQLSALRAESLPAWAVASRFNHFYRLAVNTRLPGRSAGTIRVGDAVEIVNPANQRQQPAV